MSHNVARTILSFFFGKCMCFTCCEYLRLQFNAALVTPIDSNSISKSEQVGANMIHKFMTASTKNK